MAKRKKGTGPGGGEPGADRGGSPEPGPVRGRGRKGARRRGDAGRRYSPEERRRLLEAYAKSSMTVRDFCKTMGMSDATLCKWRRRYEAEGAKGLEPRKRGRPKGSGTGSKLPEPVQAAIVETKKLFPDFGLKKLRDYVGRFLHLRVTTGGVRGVLKDAALLRRCRSRSGGGGGGARSRGASSGTCPGNCGSPGERTAAMTTTATSTRTPATASAPTVKRTRRYRKRTRVSYQTKTDAEGRYTFEELPPGSVRITAHISIESLKAEREVEVPKGGKAVADFVLGVPTVTGTVRDDATGEPLAGVSLILNWENREQWRAMSDAEGRFAFRDAPPRNYFLHVDADGYGGGGLPVSAAEGQPPDIQLRLRTAAVLRVRVLTPEGSPYVGEVGLYPTWKEPPAPFRQAWSGNLRTDRDGRATCRKVAPGEYDLSFYSRSPDGSLADRMESVVRSVRIVPGENEVEVQLVRK